MPAFCYFTMTVFGDGKYIVGVGGEHTRYMSRLARYVKYIYSHCLAVL